MTEVTPYSMKCKNVQIYIRAEFRLIRGTVCWNVAVNNKKDLDQGKCCEILVFDIQRNVRRDIFL